mmetsp:Transcript_20712/g.47560  ORF Transcript_20712/g.47560 Transcript_20712/m.47560 type:complete len:264 (-) Transcript_20712:1373-2164(-)
MGGARADKSSASGLLKSSSIVRCVHGTRCSKKRTSFKDCGKSQTTNFCTPNAISRYIALRIRGQTTEASTRRPFAKACFTLGASGSSLSTNSCNSFIRLIAEYPYCSSNRFPTAAMGAPGGPTKYTKLQLSAASNGGACASAAASSASWETSTSTTSFCLACGGASTTNAMPSWLTPCSTNFLTRSGGLKTGGTSFWAVLGLFANSHLLSHLTASKPFGCTWHSDSNPFDKSCCKVSSTSGLTLSVSDRTFSSMEAPADFRKT